MGEKIAAGSGVVLLIALFLPWYGVGIEFGGVSASENGNAWETMSFIDLLLFLIALEAIAIPLARAAGSLPAGVPGPLILLVGGALALLLVIFRIIDIPADFDGIPAAAEDAIDLSRKIGIFVALLAAAGLAYGGWRANAEVPRDAATAPSAPPPAAPPPPPPPPTTPA